MTYTTSQSQSGRGSILALMIASTYTTIGEVSDLPFERGEWVNVDVTNFESAADEEILPTIRKTGSFTLKGNRVSSDAGQAGVEAIYQSGAKGTFKLTLPLNTAAGQSTTGDTYAFTGYVLASTFSVSPEKQIEFSIKIQTTGPVVLTVGS